MGIKFKTFSEGGRMIETGFDADTQAQVDEATAILGSQKGEYEIWLNRDGTVRNMIGQDADARESIDGWLNSTSENEMNNGSERFLDIGGTRYSGEILELDFFKSLTQAAAYGGETTQQVDKLMEPYGIYAKNHQADADGVFRATEFKVADKGNALAIQEAIENNETRSIYNRYNGKWEDFTPNSRMLEAGQYKPFIEMIKQSENNMVFDEAVNVNVGKSDARIQDKLASDSVLDNAVGYGAMMMKTAMTPEDYQAHANNTGLMTVLGLMEIPQRGLGALFGQSFFDPRTSITRPLMDWVNQGGEEEDQEWLKENKENFFFNDDELVKQTEFYGKLEKQYQGGGEAIKNEMDAIREARGEQGTKGYNLKTDETLALARMINHVSKKLNVEGITSYAKDNLEDVITVLTNRREELSDSISPPGHWVRDILNGVLNVAGDPSLLTGVGGIGVSVAKRGIARGVAKKALQKNADELFSLSAQAKVLDAAEESAEKAIVSDGFDGIAARTLEKSPKLKVLQQKAKAAWDKGLDWASEKYLAFDDIILNGGGTSEEIIEATNKAFTQPGAVTETTNYVLNTLLDKYWDVAASKLGANKALALEASKGSYQDTFLHAFGIKQLRMTLSKIDQAEPGVLHALFETLESGGLGAFNKALDKIPVLTDAYKKTVKEKIAWIARGGPVRHALAIGKTTNFEKQVMAVRTWDNAASKMTDAWFNPKIRRADEVAPEIETTEVFRSANKIQKSITESNNLLEAKVAMEQIDNGQVALADLSGKIFKSDDDVFQYKLEKGFKGSKGITVSVNKESAKFKALSDGDKARYLQGEGTIPYVDKSDKESIIKTLNDKNRVASMDATKQTHLDGYNSARSGVSKSKYGVSETGAVYNKEDPDTILGFVDEQPGLVQGESIKTWDVNSFTPYSEGIIKREMRDKATKEMIDIMPESSALDMIYARSGSLTPEDSKDIADTMLTIVGHQYHDSDKKTQVVALLSGMLKKDAEYVEFLANIKRTAEKVNSGNAKQLLRQGLQNNVKAGKLGVTKEVYGEIGQMPEALWLVERNKIIGSYPQFEERSAITILDNLRKSAKKGEPYNPIQAVDEYMAAMTPDEVKEFTDSILEASRIADGLSLTETNAMLKKANEMSKKAGMYANNQSGTVATTYNQDLKAYEDMLRSKIRKHMSSKETVGRGSNAQVSPIDAENYSKLSAEREYKAGILNTWAHRFGDYGGVRKGEAELLASAEKIQGEYLNRGLKEFENGSWEKKHSVYNQLKIYDEVMAKVYAKKGIPYESQSEQMFRVAQSRYRGLDELGDNDMKIKDIGGKETRVSVTPEDEAMAMDFKKNFGMVEGEGGAIQVGGNALAPNITLRNPTSAAKIKAAKKQKKANKQIVRRLTMAKGYKALYKIYTDPKFKYTTYASLASRGYDDRERQKLAKHFSSENEYAVLKDFENHDMAAWSDFKNGVKGFFGANSYTPLSVGDVLAQPLSTIRAGENGIKKRLVTGKANPGYSGFETEAGNFVVLEKPIDLQDFDGAVDLTADWEVSVYKSRAKAMAHLKETKEAYAFIKKNGKLTYDYDSGFNNTYGWKKTAEKVGDITKDYWSEAFKAGVESVKKEYKEMK